MKYSQYNTLIPFENGNSILYNATSDNFVVLTSNAANEIKSHTANEIKEGNISLYKQLENAKAIIDDNVDEAFILKKKIDERVNDKTFYQLFVNPTLDCNFRCWYCYEKHQKGSIMSDNTLAAVKKHIGYVFETQKELQAFHLNFFGGEPLLGYKKVVYPLINYCKNKCKEHNTQLQLQFTTNGYLINEKILADLKECYVDFQITLDGGKEHHDKTRFLSNGKGSFNAITQNIALIAQHHKHVCLRINFTADNIESVTTIKDFLGSIPDDKRDYISIDFQRVWQDIDQAKNDNTDEKAASFIEGFKQLGYNVSSYNTPQSALHLCYGDRNNQVLVNYDGKIFKCTARDFTEQNALGRLLHNGTIEWKSNLLQERQKSKFNHAACHKCNIAPLCGGSCTQHAYELKDVDSNTCLFNYSEEDKRQKVLNRFEYLFMLNK